MYRPSIGSWPDHSKFDAPFGCQIYIQLYILLSSTLTLLKKRNPTFLTIFNNNYFQFLQKKTAIRNFAIHKLRTTLRATLEENVAFLLAKKSAKSEKSWEPLSATVAEKSFRKTLQSRQNWEPLSAKNKRNWNAEEWYNKNW